MTDSFFMGQSDTRRGGRVVECARLESACFRKGTGGSNPSLSAIYPF